MKITYWSDYACPFCYIGETHLKQALSQLGLENTEVEMLAFELNPDAPKVYSGTTLDRFAKKYGLTREMAAQRIESISQMGRAAGLDFRYAETRSTNTFDAHRLTKLARKLGGQALADRVSERLYRAYFTETLELADHAVLRRIAVEEGMDEQAVAVLLEGGDFGMEVRLDEREAERYGVTGVPYFLIGRYAVPGAMGVEQMKEVLQKALREETDRPEQAGMTCGPDGCKIG